jgi:hypothetical protein
VKGEPPNKRNVEVEEVFFLEKLRTFCEVKLTSIALGKYFGGPRRASPPPLLCSWIRAMLWRPSFRRRINKNTLFKNMDFSAGTAALFLRRTLDIRY